MTTRQNRWRRALLLLLALPVLGMVAIPAGAVPKERPALGSRLALHISQSVATRYWIEHPDQAPEQVQERFEGMAQLDRGSTGGLAAEGAGDDGEGNGENDGRPHAAEGAMAADRFNLDDLGLPQNEESITACRSNTSIVLGGTNDYRGLFDPEGNFTGWHLSTDGGETVANEGLLPPVEIGGNPVPSGGDPVMVADDHCGALYGGGLNFDPVDPFNNPNGIGIYRSDPTTLAACPGGSDPSCWPTRRAVAVAEPSHFLDKPSFDVGESGAAGQVVWAAYSDFVIDPEAPLGFTSASIYAVRCDAELVSCGEPILISGEDVDVQFADVTIGPDGRTYISWSEIQGELPGEGGQPSQPQTFVHKLRIAPAGSTDFGRARIIRRERRAIPFGGALQANDFRIATYPKNEVKLVRGEPRVYAVWEACRARLVDTICEYPRIVLRYSDDDGRTWSPRIVLSEGGVNYFPAIADDPATGNLAVAWFTNRFDPEFHNRQDVELVTIDARGRVANRQRITSASNESEADPLLGGFFIGDYIEVFAHAGTAWVHYNANYRQTEVVPELFRGFPVNQQDNYLTRTGM